MNTLNLLYTTTIATNDIGVDTICGGIEYEASIHVYGTCVFYLSAEELLFRIRDRQHLGRS